MGGAQVDLLICQFQESGVLVRADAVGAELIEGSVFLLGPCREVRTGLQRGGGRAERCHSDTKTKQLNKIKKFNEALRAKRTKLV